MTIAARLKNPKKVFFYSFGGFMLLFLSVPALVGHIAFNYSNVFTYLMLFLVAFALTGASIWYVWNDVSDDGKEELIASLGGSLLIAALLGFAGSMFLFDRVNLSYAIDEARSKTQSQTQLLGRTPPIMADLEFASRSYENAKQHRTLIQEVSRAQRGTTEILAYLATARAFDVDGTFVQNNGMVRRSDRQALLDAALRRSSDGDLAAQEWLLSNQKSLAAR